MTADKNNAKTGDDVKVRNDAVSLDLDVLEREGDIPGAFTFQFDGKSYQMLDPQEIDWQDLLAGMRNPALFVRFAMKLDDQADFFSKRVAAWKMNKLMESYVQHYGLPDLGNASALRT